MKRNKPNQELPDNTGVPTPENMSMPENNPAPDFSDPDMIDPDMIDTNAADPDMPEFAPEIVDEVPVTDEYVPSTEENLPQTEEHLPQIEEYDPDLDILPSNDAENLSALPDEEPVQFLFSLRSLPFTSAIMVTGFPSSLARPPMIALSSPKSLSPCISYQSVNTWGI